MLMHPMVRCRALSRSSLWPLLLISRKTDQRNKESKTGISERWVKLSTSVLMTVWRRFSKVNCLSSSKASFYGQQWQEDSGQRALIAALRGLNDHT